MALIKQQAEADVFISERFQQAVSLHVLKNLLKRVEAQVPLLLGIHGPSGEGKTYQCEHILKDMGVKRFLVSGGQLDNPIAGHPSAFIRQTYIKASETIRSGGASLAVVLVNDVDTGLGTWGKSEKHTINQINVFGELMHLVDYPSLVDGKETNRVPIIITGNDFTKRFICPYTGFQGHPSRPRWQNVCLRVDPHSRGKSRDSPIHLSRIDPR